LAERQDLSFVVAGGNRGVIGIRAQAFLRPDGPADVSVHGLPSMLGTNREATPAEEDRAWQMFKRELVARLATIPGTGELLFRDYLDDGNVSRLGQWLLGRGAVARPMLNQMVDLSQSEAELRLPFSKQVRWGINWGMRHLAILLKDQRSITGADIEAFQRLHIAAAGRETRSRETWLRQLAMVQSGAAFVVFGYLEGELVTAALFVADDRHCFYGVSASKRELFAKPLGHAIVWTAMLHARNVVGARRFELGEQAYPGLPGAAPSDKEEGISFFKRSFGGRAEMSVEMRVATSSLLKAEGS
jgi:hypothetical protein